MSIPGKISLIRFLTTVMILSFISCSKGSDEEKDTQAPVITINTPNNNQVFNGSQSITITGLVTDNKYIREIHIEITNLATGEEYLHVHIHPATATSSFNQSFALQSGNNYRIRVLADDSATNSAVQKVEVSCN